MIDKIKVLSWRIRRCGGTFYLCGDFKELQRFFKIIDMYGMLQAEK